MFEEQMNIFFLNTHVGVCIDDEYHFQNIHQYDAICVGTDWTHVNRLITSMKPTVLQMHDIMKKTKNQESMFPCNTKIGQSPVPYYTADP